MSGNGQDLNWLSIKEARSLIATRQVSPVDLTKAAVAQIEKLEPTLNCFITRLEEQALVQAKEAEDALGAGSEVGLLHGIPIAVKDNIETAGVLSTGGSKILCDYVPSENAPAWGRLKEAGAILLGKTNLHEFGFGTTTINPHYGITRNPWNVDHVPGGSSGGSAAAVSAGMAFAALGTDAGGSVRIPAALCGIVGLKPTHGRVPIRGAIRGGDPTRDHIGPITRTVGDAALLLAVMSGHDSLDPTSRSLSSPSMELSSSAKLNGLRLGVPLDHYFSFVDSRVDSVIRAAIIHLAELGAEVKDVRLPDHDRLVDGLDAIRAEALVDHERWLRTRLTDYGEETQVRLLALQFIQAKDRTKALRARRLLLEQYTALWSEVDFIVAPTVAVAAPSITAAQSSTVMVNGEPYSAGTLSQITRPLNYTGLPALSVPCGFVDGLPVGLMLAGRPFDEQLLLQVANVYQQTTGWHQQRPSLFSGSTSTPVRK